MSSDAKAMLIGIYERLLIQHDTLYETSCSVAALAQAIAQSNSALWQAYLSKVEELKRETAEQNKKARAHIAAVISELKAKLPD